MSDEGKLFVGGLSFDTNEESLAAAFGKYGTIEKVDVIMDRDSGKSRGFGFVKYANPEDAKDALEGMNGKTLDGRPIRVDEAGKGGGRSRGGGGSGPRGRGGFGGRGRGGGGYYGDRSYGDRSYSDRSDRSYGDRSFSNEGRFGGGGGGGGSQYRSGGGGYRDNRSQPTYGDRSSYREQHDYDAE